MFEFTLGFSFLGFLYALTMIYTVKQRQEALITSFGKYMYTQQKPGLRIKWPWPFNVVEARILTSLQQISDTLETKTNDDLFVRLPITTQFFIRDTARFYFDNQEPILQISKLVNAEVRKYTSSKDFQALYDERDEISDVVIDALKEQIDDYGVVLHRIIIDEPEAPKSVEEAFNKVRASERLKDAAKNEADADFIRRVKAAEADKERNILIGEGVAGFRKKIADGYGELRQMLVEKGVDTENADQFMRDAMHMDTLRDIGDRGNMVIVTESGMDKDDTLTNLLKYRNILSGDLPQAGKAANQAQ